MAQHRLERKSVMMIRTKTPPTGKSRKRTVSEILREAYTRHCRDRITRHVLRVHLKK